MTPEELEHERMMEDGCGAVNRNEIIERLLELPHTIACAERWYAEAVQQIALREAMAVRDGEAVGKNEQERKATLTLILQPLEEKASARRVELHRLQNEHASLRSVARLLGGGER